MFAAQDGVTPTSVIYADDVFSTYLYTGNGSTQTINNGIDLAGKGGMVWGKSRTNVLTHHLFDSARGPTKFLKSNSTGAQGTSSNLAFSSTGFTAAGDINALNQSYVSWTFRKAPKFFDVVTYTGTGASQVLTHNLGVKPGIVIVKATSTTGDWPVWARETGDTAVYVTISSGYLNATTAPTRATSTDYLNAMTSTTFNPYWITGGGISNTNGVSYVAYLFAHDTSSTGLIQCGSYTGNGSATGPTVTLGWEPQWLLVKNASGTGNWNIFDSMRGFTVAGQNDAYLEANTTDAEALADWVAPSATGFQITTTSTELNTNTSTYIYIAIRRPNKPPTTGTQVFYNDTDAANSGGSNSGPSTGFDLGFISSRAGGTNWEWIDRLRSLGLATASTLTTAANALSSNNTAAEVASTMIAATVNQGVARPTQTFARVVYTLKRAPGFFDIVCYTGDATTGLIAHNLTVRPELIIVKRRGVAGNFAVNVRTGTNTWIASSVTGGFVLNASTSSTDTFGYDSFITATQFGPLFIGAGFEASNTINRTYVAYLFATLPGISKVGTYTGNGTSQTINAGFTTGARFIMIKSTNQITDWWVWDSARGIIAGNDPALAFNSTAAETTTIDAIDPDNSGFIVNKTGIPINESGYNYIYLAIA